jgi:hypothetical protein
MDARESVIEMSERGAKKAMCTLIPRTRANWVNHEDYA